MRAGQEELDHFIPWSLYPNDLAHNFVLACRACNASKKAKLASSVVYGRWIERNHRFDGKIAQVAVSIGLPANATVSAKVAAWAYAHGGVEILSA
jgi:hypothetical protein